MSFFKRIGVFITSCAAIFIIMAAVLNSEENSTTVFSSNPSTLTVLDEESLLPVDSCSIIIINDDKSYKTDSDGQVEIDAKDVSLIAYKDGYAPYLLLHHDFQEDCRIFLKKGGLASFTAKVDDRYAKKIIGSFLKREQKPIE